MSLRRLPGAERRPWEHLELVDDLAINVDDAGRRHEEGDAPHNHCFRLKKAIIQTVVPTNTSQMIG